VRSRLWLILALVLLSASGFSEPGPLLERWVLENDRMEVVYGWFPDGGFRLVSFRDKQSSLLWASSTKFPAGVINLGTRSLRLTGMSAYALPTASHTEIEKNGKRLTVALRIPDRDVEITLESEVYPGQPFVRQKYRFKNLGTSIQTLTSASFLEASFEDRGQRFRALHLNQWVAGGREGNFELHETDLAARWEPLRVTSGAYAQHCAWLAIRDGLDQGLVAGWEFNGRAQLAVHHDFHTESLNLTGSVSSLNQPLQPGEIFESPAVFVGIFEGDWDEAAYRTQRFTEAVLAAPMPDRQRFPYVAWDSWGYGDQIDEVTLRSAADVAARLGVELFTVDLGWARALGDWQADASKFPSGMRAFSDYVHARGMKFGLHVPLLEADPGAPVLRQNPDWTATTSDGFYGAVSLCPGHEPAKQWIIADVVRLIREYNVDWVLQDGLNPVKQCSKRTHTHHRRNSNYANSAKGIDEIVAAIRREAPQTVWENCQSGGRMMTYQMVRDNVTSIASDDSDSLTTRQAVYGATFPFPPRYTDRYSGEETFSKFSLRSGMFGGPWILMQRLTEWDEAEIRTAAEEVALYKSLRLRIRDGKVFHLTPRPDGRHNEALQSYDNSTDSAVIFVYRPQSPEDSQTVMPRGLRANFQYRVRLQEAGTLQLATGGDLMNNGILVPLPEREFAEIVIIEKADGGQ